ncbi:class I SAM-dependent methyltransferase [Salipiger sp. IMCC34102]|uniref:class I SAM-dependent methyltransferase n=1 Tax=Salipiger sp. IMCC34102 TaxID=2510647 RepID=UPI00101BD4E2|nr:SAM-dependent methyltransferase [Salipiger sp. IMCC34102]RYH01431.1 class I SAM-dependent methyltransferase [Salipiger sp. IMCC34102]
MNLADRLRARIANDGPMPLSDYMSACLLDPAEGYYVTRDPLGSAGDFVTAPEVSQMFGELLGLSLAQAWLNQGAPSPVTLAEPGPGRGTLMADILRATRGVPGFHAAAQVHLVEASPTLRAAQATRVPQATWHDRLDTLPQQPLFLVANEFFDALPIRQFQRDGTNWRERVVGLRDDRLTLGLTDPTPHATLAHRLADTRDGDIVEICPTLAPAASAIGERISAHGGAALIIDYGDWTSLGDTFQAVQGHRIVDPFADPGQADLTAHVDFNALAAAAAPARHSRVTPQGVFLERLGITARAQALAGRLTGSAQEALVAAHRRLTHPAEMGDHFKVMGLFPDTQAPPPGVMQ